MTSTSDLRAQPLAPGARRALYYLLYDKRGEVDDYVVYALESLRPFAQRITVIVNGALTDEGRVRLTAVSDEILQRENTGFDVGGYQEAIEKAGTDDLATFDEVILTNYTWFGPVRPLAPVFESMDARPIDFWGITDHGEYSPNPFTGVGSLPAHIQSHWIAVRRSIITSEAWAQYWREMPEITSYSSSIMNHEARFTPYFTEAGFVAAVAFPHENYPATTNPVSDSAHLLLRDGCPIFKRRLLFQDPLYLDRNAIIGRWLIDAAAETGYPAELIWSNIVKSTSPKVLNTAASMLEVLPDIDLGYDSNNPLRVAAAVHIYYDDMTDELLDRVCYLPGPVDLYVTTPDDERAARIRDRIAARADASIAHSDVRVLPSNRGRDQSAFYVELRDVIVDSAYDVIVKIHSKKSVQDGATIGRFFKKQQIGNLLHSPGYAANLLRLFQREPGLGAVFPPMVHIGHPTLGGAWFGNREKAAEFAAQAGIHVPLDEISPLAPLGGMFAARPAALRRMMWREWSYDDYPSETEYGDGALSHVQERMVAYSAAEDGYHVRTVAHAGYIAISHTYLEYKLDHMSAAAQGYAMQMVPEVVDAARRGIRLAKGGAWVWVREYLNLKHPGFMARVKRLVRR